jgi:hypothetical protein
VGRTFPVGDRDALSRAIAEIAKVPAKSEAIAAVSRKHSLQAAVSGIATALTMMKHA